jgi:hypothetical protein
LANTTARSDAAARAQFAQLAAPGERVDHRQRSAEELLELGPERHALRRAGRRAGYHVAGVRLVRLPDSGSLREHARRGARHPAGRARCLPADARTARPGLE